MRMPRLGGPAPRCPSRGVPWSSGGVKEAPAGVTVDSLPSNPLPRRSGLGVRPQPALRLPGFLLGASRSSGLCSS
jgi:hypothetical protein